MAEETKTQNTKTTENQPNDVKSKNCCNDGSGTKTVILVVILILVAVGLAAAAKFAIFRHNARNLRTGRFEQFDSNRAKGLGFNRGFAANGPEDCPLHSGNSVVSITAISGDKLTVKASGKDQTVNITPDTSITKNSEIAAKSDLRVNDVIVVRGTSNSAGEIVATSITVK